MDPLSNVLENFTCYTAKPEKYLSIQESITENIKQLSKTLYDHLKNEEERDNKKSDALPELIIRELDEEQIWQQMQLQNESKWNDLLTSVSWLTSDTNKLLFPIEIEDSKKDYLQNDVLFENEDVELQADDEPMTDIRKKSNKYKEVDKSNAKKGKKSIVDDEFFKLDEMEKFLNLEDKKEMIQINKTTKSKKISEDDDSINMFEPGDSLEENEAVDIKYNDFFGNSMDNENNEYSEGDKDTDSDFSSEDNSSEVKNTESKNLFEEHGMEKGDKEIKSDFELRQERLERKMKILEEKRLKEKDWQMKGEILSSSRPINSLLGEVVDFDLTSRPAPVITEETTLKLEDIIKQRIKDKVWDDVIRKSKPINQPSEYKKAIILDQEKSKLSLAELYERDYLKTKQSLHGVQPEQDENKQHKEIKLCMRVLFEKLDALSNYHYTAKEAVPDVKIVSNIPAITMEEVTPVAVSDASLLAPEEIKAKQNGELLSKEEKTVTDKKRERRKKKQHQRLRQSKEINGEKLKTGAKYNDKQGSEKILNRLTKGSRGIDKMDIKNNDKSLKSSKAFFSELNDNMLNKPTKKNMKSTKLAVKKYKF